MSGYTGSDVLPGGFVKNNKVFYTGFSQETSSGPVKFGMEGVVLDAKDSKIIVKFPNFNLTVPPSDLFMSPPSTEFAGGYNLDDTVFYVASTQPFSNGTLEKGSQGTVVGPGPSGKIFVKFSGIQQVLTAELKWISKSPPAEEKLPDGFSLNSPVFLTCGFTVSSGEKFALGTEGIVVGGDQQNVNVKLPGVDLAVSIEASLLSTSKPSTELPGDAKLPDGFSLNNTVFLTSGVTLDSGKSLAYATEGTVVGGDQKKVKVKFPEIDGAVEFEASLLSTSKPSELPDGMCIDDKVYYTGKPQYINNGPDMLAYSCECTVVRPATGNNIFVRPSGNEVYLPVPISDIAKERPPVSFIGGYGLNDDVFFTGKTQEIGSSVTLTAGSAGTVVAPVGKDSLFVSFAGIKGFIQVKPTDISRDKP